MKTWLSSRSPRERALLIGAAAIASVILLVYGALIPGQSAVRSAADRNALAAANLAEAKALAADLSKAMGPEATDTAGLLAQIAADHGLIVVEQRVVDGVMDLRLVSENSVSALAWADDVSRRADAALRTLSISREPQGGVVIDASFTGAWS